MANFRLDRAISVAVGRAGFPLRLLNHRPRIPVLMYHGIRECDGCARPYFETHTTPHAFEAQMSYLRQSGYHTLTPGEAVRALTTGSATSKHVVITFDDGYRDFYSCAAPVLAAHGLSATLYLVTGFMEHPHTAPKQESYITWAEARELQASGIQIGSHSVTHGRLREQNPAQREQELGDSKRRIEDVMGCEVESFAFPYSFPEQDKDFMREMREMLQSCGYKNAMTTVLGSVSSETDPYFLPRLPVNLFDDIALFAAKLEGAYDWMHAAQRIHKRVAAPRRAQVQIETVSEN